MTHMDPLTCTDWRKWDTLSPFLSLSCCLFALYFNFFFSLCLFRIIPSWWIHSYRDIFKIFCVLQLLFLLWYIKYFILCQLRQQYNWIECNILHTFYFWANRSLWKHRSWRSWSDASVWTLSSWSDKPSVALHERKTSWNLQIYIFLHPLIYTSPTCITGPLSRIRWYTSKKIS